MQVLCLPQYIVFLPKETNYAPVGDYGTITEKINGFLIDAEKAESHREVMI